MKVLGFIPISVWDLLDVAIISVFIYFVLRVLSGTKVIVLMAGITLLFLIGLIAKVLQLPSLSLLVSAVQTFGIVILIVIFQPEMRKFLMEMGSLPLVKFFIPEESVPIDEILSAIEEILRRRLGALIIIERRLSLRDFAEDTGVIIDGKLSAPLLVSIFDKRSPLHDGAVIIKNDRIIASSVMVPMSVRYRGTGARHRAAAGITEVSDAISIAVSEERGTITLFHKGEAYYNLTLERLRTYLERLLRYEKI
ncbi:MAG: diadenylate cyclase CdaA [candidate division WOR-3 bacterium]